MSVFIGHVSRYGTCARVSAHIAEIARAAGRSVRRQDLREDATLDPDATIVVLVGAVYSNQHDDLLVRYLREHATRLSQVRTCLASVSLAAALGTDEGEAMTLDYVEELSSLSGVKLRHVALLAGSLDESACDPSTRALLKVAVWRRGLATPDGTGDVSFVDPQAIEAATRRWFGPGA